jgi:ubiquinone/menaquinone biosynthesis C-methylase UbiE
MIQYSKKLAQNYAKNRAKHTSTDAFFLELLNKSGLKNKTILDFGCGDGFYSLYVHGKGAKEVCGIDSSPEMIRLANIRKKDAKNSDIIFKVADGNNLPFIENKFDIIFANFVLVHFDDLQKPLSEIYRILKTGGIFIATINCTEDALKPTKVSICLGEDIVVTSFLRSGRNLKAIIEKTKFNVVDIFSIKNNDAKVDSKDVAKYRIKDIYTVLFSLKK